MSSSCIFNSPPLECVFCVNNACVFPAGGGLVARWVLNHRRLMLTSEGRTRALQDFTEAYLDSPRRQKPLSGQAGRDLIE